MIKKVMISAVTILVTGLAVFMGLRFAARPAPDHPYYRQTGFRIIAHRGGMGIGPENTLEALSRSLKAGADALEMDIRTTKDGVFVLLHDATVDRTTNGNGAVREMTLADIKKLDAGYRWVGDKRTSFRNRGITIPTLEEVLAAFPEIPLVIEIKPNRPELCNNLCGLIKHHRKTESVLIASMHSPVLSEFRSVCPEVATSAGPKAVRWFYFLCRARLTSLLSPHMVVLQVPVSYRGRPVVTPDFVAAAHGRNLKVEVWTVNEIKAMRWLIEAGVDGIFTDYPGRMKSVADTLF